jgi:hypothetical protein
MRIIIFFIIVLILIIGMGIYFQNMLNKESREMIQGLEGLVIQIQNENWEEAEGKLSELEAIWKHKRRKWHAISDHLEIARVDESLTRLGALLRLKENEDCLVEIAVLKQNILYIPDKEKLTLSNIF